MNILRRFLLCLWGVMLIAVAAMVGVCAFRYDVGQYWLGRMEILLHSGRFFWWMMLCGVVLLLVGILSLFAAFARKARPYQVVIGIAEGGQMNISMDAVDNVVRKAVLGVNGVKEVKSHLKPLGNSVDVKLEITIPHDISAPETAAAVQEAVKSQLLAIAGITVEEVAVLISGVEGKAM